MTNKVKTLIIIGIFLLIIAVCIIVWKKAQKKKEESGFNEKKRSSGKIVAKKVDVIATPKLTSTPKATKVNK